MVPLSLLRLPSRPQAMLLFILMHTGAFLALTQFYTPLGFGLFLISAYFVNLFGLSIGYHRFLTHRSFKTHRWVECLIMLAGNFALSGHPIVWVINHRLHHQHADQALDPHSPVQRGFIPIMFWVIFLNPKFDLETARQTIPDLLEDPFAQWLAKHTVLINVLAMAGLFLIGYLYEDVYTGISCVLWAGCLQVVISWALAGLTGSTGHMAGARPYNMPNNSVNVWWMFPFLTGECWHNNHHITPNAASFGHKWWELDPCYWMIRVMACLGLAWDIVPVRLVDNRSGALLS